MTSGKRVGANMLVFFATDWGYRHGGVNAFNIDLCKAVASLVTSEIRVACVVPASSPEQSLDAAESGVQLISLSSNEEQGKHLSAPALERLKDQLNLHVLWWVGHDTITGFWAHDAWRALGGDGIALIHHMDYDAYKYLQAWPSEDSHSIEKQNRLLGSANVVLAVGPRLFSSAKDKTRGQGGTEIRQLIPGLPRVVPLKPSDRFRALTMGRLEPKNNIIKQLQLAAVSFGAAVGRDPDVFGPDPALTVLGVSEAELTEQQHELLTTVEKEAGRVVAVHARQYHDDRTKLLDDLRRHSVLLMLSLHEGFGLAGWEAIGAGVPLIVSTNSGVYETVDRFFGGMGTGCLEAIEVLGSVNHPYYHVEDRSAVSKALLRVAKRQTRAKENALTLRALIEQFCSWQNTAADFCSALNVRTRETAVSLNLSRWTSDFLAEAIKSLNTAVNAATRRKLQFQALWDGLKPPSKFQRFIMLFGGISTALSDDDAFTHYADWLLANHDAELFICYEAGQSALARARALDPENIEVEATTELPKETEARMLAKEAHVRDFCERLHSFLQDRNFNCAKRFNFVAIHEPLTTYVMVADADLFVTPLMSRRSSETLSFLLAKRPIQFPLDVLHYVIYNLDKLEKTESLGRALAYLTLLIKTEYTQE